MGERRNRVCPVELSGSLVHEISNQDAFSKEIAAILKANGQVLIVEPPFHVSGAAFEETIRAACNAGLTPTDSPKILFSKTVILKKKLIIQNQPTGELTADLDMNNCYPSADFSVGLFLKYTVEMEKSFP